MAAPRLFLRLREKAPLAARSALLSLPALALLGAGGCSAYHSNYYFEPSPLEVATPAPDEGAMHPVRTLVSVVGVRRADEEAGLPKSVEIALRVDNHSGSAITLDVGSLALFSADVERFPDPVLEPTEDLRIEPGQGGSIKALFPAELAGGESYDLDGLQLRWTLEVGGERIVHSAAFRRLHLAPYYHRYQYHYGYPYYGFNFGLHGGW